MYITFEVNSQEADALLKFVCRIGYRDAIDKSTTTTDAKAVIDALHSLKIAITEGNDHD